MRITWAIKFKLKKKNRFKHNSCENTTNRRWFYVHRRVYAFYTLIIIIHNKHNCFVISTRIDKPIVRNEQMNIKWEHKNHLLTRIVLLPVAIR